jgi:phosphomannomutase
LGRDTYRSTLERIDSDRTWSHDRYSRFVLMTAAKSSDGAQLVNFKESLRKELTDEALGIVGELNGSARGASIDASFLSSLGVQVALYNDRPGDVVHAIVPEGENLDLCRSLLEARYKENRSYVLGYSVDNDGDRGNIVYIDETSGEAKILDAQSVYALALLSELAQSRLKNRTEKLATAVNGPTSMRVDAIARVFDAEVFRSEVGEANVVGLGELKRNEGWDVPILGEGSNGGNITHPARVRDPINTLVSLVQLLRRREIADLWFTRLGLDLPTHYTLTAIIESLPPFTTTAVSSPSALMRINVGHGELKRRYEALLASDWTERTNDLAEMGFTSYRVYQTEGVECRLGLGEEYRKAPYTGGYKVALCDREGREQAFLWMRGSKTEPVFRLIADVAGDRKETHDYLLAWHRSLIERASTP